MRQGYFCMKLRVCCRRLSRPSCICLERVLGVTNSIAVILLHLPATNVTDSHRHIVVVLNFHTIVGVQLDLHHVLPLVGARCAREIARNTNPWPQQENGRVTHAKKPT